MLGSFFEFASRILASKDSLCYC